MNTETLVIFLIFLEYILLFLDDDVIKNVNNSQIAKVKPQGVA